MCLPVVTRFRSLWIHTLLIIIWDGVIRFDFVTLPHLFFVVVISISCSFSVSVASCSGSVAPLLNTVLLHLLPYKYPHFRAILLSQLSQSFLPSDVRLFPHPSMSNLTTFLGGGWHFTNFGGVDMILQVTVPCNFVSLFIFIICNGHSVSSSCEKANSIISENEHI
jgi:hypothetical protein